MQKEMHSRTLMCRNISDLTGSKHFSWASNDKHFGRCKHITANGVLVTTVTTFKTNHCMLSHHITKFAIYTLV